MYLSVEDYKIMTEFLFDNPKSDKDILKALNSYSKTKKVLYTNLFNYKLYVSR